MANSNFTLTAALDGPLLEAQAPACVSLPLTGYTATVQAGEKLLKGSLVARCTTPDAGDLHSPVAGTVREIHGLSETALVIDAEGNQSDPGQTVAPEDLSQAQPPALRSSLAQLGINTTRLPAAKTLIINAMPHEPGISIHTQLLQDHRADVARGLEAAKRLVSPSHTILAGIDVDASALGNCAVKHIRPLYPYSLDSLVAREVTGEEAPENTALVSVLELYLLGRVMETGLPCTETVVTVAGKNVLAGIGTMARDLLTARSVIPQEKDRVVFGGLMRGTAAYTLDQGIEKDTLALQVVPHDHYPPTQDTPCLNCGECVLHCPSRILPGLISRAAEFSFFDRARGYGVDACIECGLCGYYCTGRRPLLQYIRLAKKELAELDTQKALEENTLEMADGGQQ